MQTSSATRQPHLEEGPPSWPAELFDALKAAGVRHMSYVPDAGHSALIRLFADDPEMTSNVLTTEEEGVAISAGAWLGGQRSVLLMQSSGVGNVVNMLSLSVIGRFPLLMLVTMRGEWAEFNPWQMPMGRAVEPVLQAMGVRTIRVDTPEDLLAQIESVTSLVYGSDQQIALILSQRLLGAKKW